MHIKMAAPLFQNDRFFLENDVHVSSSDNELYGVMSALIMIIPGNMAVGQEVFSIDQSFLNVTGFVSLIPLETFGQQMRARMRQEKVLVLGVGLGPTRTLARLANPRGQDVDEDKRRGRPLRLEPAADAAVAGYRYGPAAGRQQRQHDTPKT